MRTNKFSIGRLIGVHVSSIINEVIKTISSQFILFYKKIFAYKNANQTKHNQQKYKQTNKKQQRQQFLRRKTSKRGKIGYFAFLKKIETVLIASFTILLWEKRRRGSVRKKKWRYWNGWIYERLITLISTKLKDKFEAIAESPVSLKPKK